MKYNVRLSATSSGSWFVESDSDGHWSTFVALVYSEALARQIADLLNHGVLGDGVRYEFPEDALHVPQTPDTGLGAVIGKWPGAEADEEVAELLRDTT